MTRKLRLPFYAALALSLALPLGVGAQEQPPQGQQEQRRPRPEPKDSQALPPESVTRHTLQLPGRTLSFTATAGHLTLADPQGAPQAEMNPEYHLPTDSTVDADYASDIARLVTAAAWIAATR